jgi:hypothetical protein
VKASSSCENNQPVARLTAESKLQRQPRKAGSAKGLLTSVPEDDEPNDPLLKHVECTQT